MNLDISGVVSVGIRQIHTLKAMRIKMDSTVTISATVI